jgi:hypothetical protein
MGADQMFVDTLESDAAAPLYWRRFVAAPRVLLTLVVLWATLAATGLGLLWAYKATPGEIGVVPLVWPQTADLTPAKNSKTLLLFAHPRCPCTRASLSELAQVMALGQDQLHSQIVFLQPDANAEKWRNSDLVAQANALSRATVVWDETGELTRQFGVRTSGHVLLFDEAGTLLFSGGITDLRGHSSGNTGSAAVLALAQGEMLPLTTTKVFGCPLFFIPSAGASCESGCLQPDG